MLFPEKMLNFFKENDGAQEKTVSWRCNEKFNPDKSSLVLLFPRWTNTRALMAYVHQSLIDIGQTINLVLAEENIGNCSGYLRFSAPTQKNVLIVINIKTGQQNGLVLLRFLP